MVAACVLLMACGGSDAGTGAVAAPPAIAPVPAELSTTPIPFRDLYDSRNNEQLARTETIQLDTCPLLSLETLTAWSGFNEPPTLGLATTQRCNFSNGPAFGFSVEVKLAAEVDVNNHSGRAYNIDVEPVVETRSGPGEKAVMLIDTAFVKTGNDPFPYAYFFVLGDKAVTLQSRAFKIKEAGWRPMADEVATNIKSGRAGDRAQTVEVIDSIEAYTIEPCGFITIDQLATLSGRPASNITPNHKPTKATCGWKFADGSVLNFRFRAAEARYPESGQESRTDAVGVPARGSAAFYEVWLNETDRWGFQVDLNGSHSAVADLISANLVQRIQPGPSLR